MRRYIYLLVSLVISISSDIDYSISSTNGYRLQFQPTYLIIAPKIIRPNQIVKLSVTILRMYHPTINVRGSIRSNDHEYASFHEEFKEPSSRTALMQMEPNCPPGEYYLRIEGSVGNRSSGFIFENETRLIFQSKRVSVFIILSKPIYRQGMSVSFRVIPVLPNLMTSLGGFHIYVIDPTGTIVRRWLSQLTNSGIYEKKFRLSSQPTFGKWKIKVKAWDYDYEKSFGVYEFYRPRFYVNVTMPLYITQDSFGLAGTATANYTSGRPAKGSASVRLEIRPPVVKVDSTAMNNFPFVVKKLVFMDGICSFIFTMKEIRIAFKGNPVGMELHAIVYIYDWFQDMNRTGKGVTVVYDSNPSMVLLGDLSRTFKPGFSVSTYFAVVQSNGAPLSGTRRQVTINMNMRMMYGPSKTTSVKMMVRPDGIVHYEFIADPAANFITITAYYDTEGMFPQAVCKMSKVYSTFNNYLKISTSTEIPILNHYMIFTVRATTIVDTIYYMIVAGGNIVVANNIEMNMKQRTFSISLSRDMAPSARLVAYYIHNSEIVADSLNFFINSTVDNSIKININRGKDLSLNTVELTAWTEPGSMMAFSGLDYDMFSHGGNTFITEREIIDEMQEYDKYANQSYSHTWYYEEARYAHVYFPSSSYGIDTNTTFTYAGLVVFTNANSTRIMHECNETLNYLPCNDLSCYLKEKRCDGIPDCEDHVDEMGCDLYKVNHKNHFNKNFTDPFDRISHVTQHYVMNGYWLWKTYFVKPDGRIDRRATVPFLPMQWVVSALSVSTKTGLTILREPFRYPSTRPFYIKMEVPKVAKLGEQIGVRVSIFNYWDRPIECLVTLLGSPDYVFVLVTNEVKEQSSYAPQTTAGDVQTMVYLEPSRNIDIYLPVLPTIRGSKINITVSAKSFMGEGFMSKEVMITYDGVINQYNTPYFIDLLSSGSVITPDFWITIPDRFLYPENRHHLYVPGSPRGYITVIGDVVGTAFIKPLLNAENTLRKPYGNAEAALYNLAVNINYLKFMRETDQLPLQLLKDTLEPMNQYLQRILSYMNADGSFSMFRDYQVPTPSTWLTAIALKTLEDADEPEWRPLGFFIPTTLRNRIGLWLAKQQNPITGEFLEGAPNYDRKMIDQDNLSTNGTHICLTAHVLSVLSTVESLTSNAQKAAILAKNRAITYLTGFLRQISNPYMICIVAYALDVAKSNSRSEAFHMLELLATRGKGDTTKYWSKYEILVNQKRIIENVPLLDSRNPYPYEATALEATSYALLVYMRISMNSDLLNAKPIMSFIQALRNNVGGFSSTRDSIIAQRALMEYGRRDTSRAMYELRIEITMAAMPEWKRIISIDKTNWLIPQIIELPKVYGQVKARMSGTGLALFMLTTEVRVEIAALQAPAAQVDFFNPAITDKFYDITYDWSFKGYNSSVFIMNICARWNRADLWQKTGLTLMEVELPTGYWMMNNELRTYVQSGEVETLRRARFYDQKVVFYFDYLEYSKKTCVKFRSDRWYPVANVSLPHEIHVYDFYEPGVFTRDVYFTEALFKQHICLVCASFQCPYCPFYNSAPHMSAMSPVAFVLVLMVSAYSVLSQWSLSDQG